MGEYLAQYCFCCYKCTSSEEKSILIWISCLVLLTVNYFLKKGFIVSSCLPLVCDIRGQGQCLRSKGQQSWYPLTAASKRNIHIKYKKLYLTYIKRKWLWVLVFWWVLLCMNTIMVIPCQRNIWNCKWDEKLELHVTHVGMIVNYWPLVVGCYKADVTLPYGHGVQQECQLGITVLLF